MFCLFFLSILSRLTSPPHLCVVIDFFFVCLNMGFMVCSQRFQKRDSRVHFTSLNTHLFFFITKNNDHLQKQLTLYQPVWIYIHSRRVLAKFFIDYVMQFKIEWEVCKYNAKGKCFTESQKSPLWSLWSLSNCNHIKGLSLQFLGS